MEYFIRSPLDFNHPFPSSPVPIWEVAGVVKRPALALPQCKCGIAAARQRGMTACTYLSLAEF